MRLRLRLRFKERTFDVPASVTIGRKPTCEVHLNYPTVSGRHAQIFLAEGRWVVLDLASKNGTYVNGERLSDVPVPLKDGDVIGMDSGNWHHFHVILEAA